jgi:hypothetical protein
MHRWEYQTLLVKQRSDKVVEVIQVNSKEAKPVEPGKFLKDPVYTDLPIYLGEAGRDGWEVTGVSPVTTALPSSGMGEGRVTILVIMKRPIE